jgi:hypothetical protein
MRLHRFLLLPLWLPLLIAPGLAPAQAPTKPAPARPDGPQPAEPPAQAKVEMTTVGPVADEPPFYDLIHRYRFVEQYTKDEKKASPELIGQYQVRIWEELTDTIDSPEGPSKPADITRETVYTERPAEVSALGVVNATIRSYSKFLVRPDDAARKMGPRPLDGLTIWYRPQPGGQPLVMSLTGERPLREREYDVTARQVFLPHLTLLLPGSSVRVGDSWRVGHKAVQALLGESDLKGDQFFAKFRELRRSKDKKTTFAVFSVSGRVSNKLGDTLISEQVVFTFPTPGAPADRPTNLLNPGTAAPPASARPDETPIEAKGAITEVRMGRSASGVLPAGPNKGKTFHASQKLVLERRLAALVPDNVMLKLFEPPPENSVTSWLTYEDPTNRFSFTHPQDLLPPDRYQVVGDFGPDTAILVKTRPEGRDLVRIEFFPKELTPESLKEVLGVQWKQLQVEVLPGNEGWLTESEWPRMKVYHIEAALKPPSRGQRSTRIHYDAYVVQLDKNASFSVIATTNRDSVEKFRGDVEKMIKTFRLVRKAGA